MGFGVWKRLLRVHRHAAIRVHERVRLVRMDGCMAHVRGEVKDGSVVAVEAKRVYGDTQMRPWAKIRLDSGTIVERCAEPNNWFRHIDGVMEYRY